MVRELVRVLGRASWILPEVQNLNSDVRSTIKVSVVCNLVKLSSLVPERESSEITPTSAEYDTHGCCADNAIDKDLSTAAATSTVDGYGSLKIKFSSSYFFRMVLIYYRFYTNWFDPNLWCVLNEDNFKKCVDLHSDVDVSVYQGEVKQKSCGTLTLSNGLEQSDQIYTLLCNVPADNLRFTKTSPDHIVIAEVTVTGAEINIFLLHKHPSTNTSSTNDSSTNTPKNNFFTNTSTAHKLINHFLFE
ncbi:hypothetical protein ACHWQZ_G000369 [Mnemiopsis leidyi]